MMCLIFFMICEEFLMQKLKMKSMNSITFKEGCEKYLEYCRQRNLREGTINHYKQSYTQFYKFFDPEMPLEAIDESAYKSYVLYLQSNLILQVLFLCEVDLDMGKYVRLLRN